MVNTLEDSYIELLKSVKVYTEVCGQAHKSLLKGLQIMEEFLINEGVNVKNLRLKVY